MHGYCSCYQTVRLKEVLGVAVAGQRQAVHSDAAAPPGPVDQQIHHHLPDADAASFGHHVDVADAPQDGAVVQGNQTDRPVADDGLVRWCRPPSARTSARRSLRRLSSSGSERASSRDHTEPPRRGVISAAAAAANSATAAMSAWTARLAPSFDRGHGTGSVTAMASLGLSRRESSSWTRRAPRPTGTRDRCAIRTVSCSR